MLLFRINKSLHNILLKVQFSVLIEIIGRKKELLPLLNLNLLLLAKSNNLDRLLKGMIFVIRNR